ncbi:MULTISPECIES: copper homeostasis membrane protein CopD [Brevundimonas]|uniref:Putative copper resistance protein D n=1 Tax=Brevundimonas variabilis TaxID=74312 RepID=A0A7W9CJG5_9CAUL|nr:copper homeostasis membrane protein CopD [Brevundimonas sp.]MBB5746312.1 putative copper resistance protein D [Brevundimonas variabilis]MBJ7447142.1 copper homeostasis membrane protein CopD [Brevundimonas sp.]
MPIDLTVVGLRWLQFAAAVLALGLPLFHGFGLSEPGPPSVRRAAVIAGLVLAVTAMGGLLAQTAMMAGGWTAGVDPAALGYVVQSTSLGIAHVVRAGLAMLGVATLVAWRRKSGELIAILAFAGAVASFAWSGHGAASEGSLGLLHLAADIAHALAACVWIGALAGFCLLLIRPSTREVGATARSLAGFASIGTVTVAVLVITGLINAAFLIGAEGLVHISSSTWGLLLIAKLVLFAVMVGLAAHNRFNLTPALSRAVEAQTDADDAVRRLRTSIGLEMLAGFALLGLVAAMGVQMPPASM